MNCPKCSAENKNGAKFCISCGSSMQQEVVSDGSVRQKNVKSYVSGKNPNTATIISFLLAGGGQFYNGDIMKGVVMLVGAILLFVTGIGFIGIWIWSMIDAYNVAKGNWKRWT